MKNIITLAIIIISLSACISSGPKKAYQGAEKELSELSVIRCGLFIIILSIDGNEVNDNKKFCSYKVLPGPHTVTYKYYQRAGNNANFVYHQKHRVEFESKAAHKYMLSGSRPNEEFMLWFIESDANDKTTKNKFNFKSEKI